MLEGMLKQIVIEYGQKGVTSAVQTYPKKLVLFDSETSTMYTLNETATFLFNQYNLALS